MRIEEFFEHAGKSSRWGHLCIHPGHDDAGGWVAQFEGRIGYGNTIAVAIQAIHDNVLNLPSRRGRLHPPFCPSFSPEPQRVAYDYRTRDWKPE